MGDAKRRKLLRPAKVRIRTDEEVLELLGFYRRKFPTDSFAANFWLLLSELSEYSTEIDMTDPVKLAEFVNKNQDDLAEAFKKRFKNPGMCVIPGLFDDPKPTINEPDWGKAGKA